MLGLGLLTAFLTAGMLYYVIRLNGSGSDLSSLPRASKKEDEEEEEVAAIYKKVKDFGDGSNGSAEKKTSSKDISMSSVGKDISLSKNDATKTTMTKERLEETNKEIEEADKRGKALFKAKKFLEAATCFSEALDLISPTDSSNNTLRQRITLTNNRSAMYEKAGQSELALEDCDHILSLDIGHSKARLRKLRVLESKERWMEALTVVCALQLKFMQDNRDQLRMGIPVQPPVPPSKIEDIVSKMLPEEQERQFADLTRERQNHPDQVILPSVYTILQLLQSFSGYNSWMAVAAKGGNVQAITDKLAQCTITDTSSTAETMTRSNLLFQRGRRYAFDRDFQSACKDFEEAFQLFMNNSADDGQAADAKLLFGEEDYPRLLEWVAMCHHLKYNLDSAANIYEKCAALEPLNAELLVKRAGVKMDGGDQATALSLFQKALEIDPSSADALLHRANLYVLQQQPLKAKADLEKAISLQPNHILAQLRLATVYMTMDNLDEASSCLTKAEAIDDSSSEVHSYRGEMHFAKGEMEEAKAEFRKAMECDTTNPTPYLNIALAIMNMPASPAGGPPNVREAIEMLEKSIEIDSHFHSAYVHLGQLKLTVATNLTEAREVIQLYDKGMKSCCRSPDELRDIVSMRLLTVAQIDAATSMKMETLNMQ